MPSPLPVVPNLPVAEIRAPAPISPGGGPGRAGEFQSILANAIGGVERLRTAAGKSVEQFIAGEGGEVHSVALATQRAELALELFLQVRNKVVSAYQSVMQMQV